MIDKTKLSIIMMFSNATIIAIFAKLAIVFDKWWIVLISGLFINSFKSETD